MSEHAVSVTTWHLEQSSADEVRPGRAPADLGLSLVRAESAGPEFARFLYTAVGGAWSWTDRLPWTYRQWEQHLAREGVEIWVAWVHGSPAGFAELEPHADGVVEIAYFGLLPAFVGRRIGGHLLGRTLQRAWDLAERHPTLPGTRLVTVHTCSLDSPAALRNYEARGMRVCRTETAEQQIGTAPGPWPGAHRDEPTE
ncbi:GNAT family N-acetyltransferase [Kitasatospora sp. NBC_00315]|uniref:GNAT family N-acetyltransferase n=1 Tax=Kitasatospora sp. NBC_00315 TaxID=2975963 RepID=UPI003252A611